MVFHTFDSNNFASFDALRLEYFAESALSFLGDKSVLCLVPTVHIDILLIGDWYDAEGRPYIGAVGKAMEEKRDWEEQLMETRREWAEWIWIVVARLKGAIWLQNAASIWVNWLYALCRLSFCSYSSDAVAFPSTTCKGRRLDWSRWILKCCVTNESHRID